MEMRCNDSQGVRQESSIFPAERHEKPESAPVEGLPRAFSRRTLRQDHKHAVVEMSSVWRPNTYRSPEWFTVPARHTFRVDPHCVVEPSVVPPVRVWASLAAPVATSILRPLGNSAEIDIECQAESTSLMRGKVAAEGINPRTTIGASQDASLAEPQLVNFSDAASLRPSTMSLPTLRSEGEQENMSDEHSQLGVCLTIGTNAIRSSTELLPLEYGERRGGRPVVQRGSLATAIRNRSSSLSPKSLIPPRTSGNINMLELRIPPTGSREVTRRQQGHDSPQKPYSNREMVGRLSASSRRMPCPSSMKRYGFRSAVTVRGATPTCPPEMIHGIHDALFGQRRFPGSPCNRGCSGMRHRNGRSTDELEATPLS